MSITIMSILQFTFFLYHKEENPKTRSRIWESHLYQAINNMNNCKQRKCNELANTVATILTSIVNN